MSKYLFGKGFTYHFFPINADGDPVTDVSGSPTVYLYRDKPTRDQAQNGTGSPLQTISSWTADGNGFKITVADISDPYPDSDTNEHTYWLAINYALESGADTQTVLRGIVVSRILSHDNELEVTKDDLEIFFSGIDSYLSEAKQVALIFEAQRELKGALRNSGFEWCKIRRPDRLKSALVAKVLMLFALGEIAEGTDGLELFFNEQKDRYERFVNTLTLEYDEDQDGAEDDKPASKGFSSWVIK